MFSVFPPLIKLQTYRDRVCSCDALHKDSTSLIRLPIIISLNIYEF